jgi:hypothetical protein
VSPTGEGFLGVLLLDGKMAREPGCLATADSFPYPVVHRTVEGARAPTSRAAAEALLPAYTEAARALEAEGAAAITDNCNGLFALIQEPLGRAVGVPVVTSALLAVPALARSLPGRRIGVLTFFEDSVGESLYAACGWSSEEIPVAVAGVGESRAWRDFLDTKEAPPERRAVMEDDLVAAARGLVERHPDVAAFVSECTLLPPASQAIRRRLGLPVYDVLNLLDLVMAGRRRPAASPPGAPA